MISREEETLHHARKHLLAKLLWSDAENAAVIDALDIYLDAREAAAKAARIPVVSETRL